MANISVERKRVLGIKNVIPARFGCTFKVDGEFIVFAQTITNIVFPQWYFQGVQRMRVVTYIQVAFKVCSLFFIFWFLHSPEDNWIYALIVTISSVAGGVVALLIIMFKDGLQISFVPFSHVLNSIRDAVPFFLSNVTGVIKEQGVILFTPC